MVIHHRFKPGSLIGVGVLPRTDKHLGKLAYLPGGRHAGAVDSRVAPVAGLLLRLCFGGFVSLFFFRRRFRLHGGFLLARRVASRGSLGCRGGGTFSKDKHDGQPSESEPAPQA